MGNFYKRRVEVATCWASNRISVMDTLEKYEESYAIAQEFREWIVNIGQEEDKSLSKSIMNLPKDLKFLLEKKIKE